MHQPPGRRRCWLPLVTLAAGISVATTSSGCSTSVATVDHDVIVLGLDGMDFGLTRRLMSEGKLPNFSRLAERGSFAPLGTALVPQSPVAWSDFITGLDAGGHGIFDFVHRNAESGVQPGAPYLSTSQALPAGRMITLGSWQFPLSGGGIELLRHGQAFWEPLEERGVPTTVVRIPANFPPSGTATRELSGMGTPDLTGSPGEFSFYSTDRRQFTKKDVSGGQVYPADVIDHVFEGVLQGPPNPFKVDAEEVRSEFTVYLDPVEPFVKVVVGSQEFLLAEGDWSDWIDVEFDLIPYLQSLHGMARFYLRSVRPNFELYVSPLQIDPIEPAMPISTPDSYASELAAASGRFYTQGMPEDTQALTNGVLDTGEFMEQARLAGQELIAQYTRVLENFKGGLLFYYFGNVDQVSHMMWRAMDPEHPAHDPIADPPFRGAIEERYVEMDQVVGRTLDHIDEDTLLVVMSDHGFASWRRSFHLNTWLVENEFMTLKSPFRRDPRGFFTDVDWSRTRAYGLGISGLYLNQRGREPRGIVPPRQRMQVLEEIERSLLATTDPATGQPAITRVYIRERDFLDRGHLEIGPDIVVGYAKGTRHAQDTALGGLTEEVLVDNTEAWSGDHIMDHTTVPGILLTSRALRTEVASLRQLTGAILAEYGIEGFPAPSPTSTN